MHQFVIKMQEVYVLEAEITWVLVQDVAIVVSSYVVACQMYYFGFLYIYWRVMAKSIDGN